MSSGIQNMGLGLQGAATGFDPQAYLAANPDLQSIVARFPGFDLFQHYQQYGIPEGRPASPADAAAKAEAQQAAQQAAQAAQGPAKAPPIPSQPGPALSGSGGSAWDHYMRGARQQSLGLNNLPTMAPTANYIPTDRSAARNLFVAGPPAAAPGNTAASAAAAGAAGSDLQSYADRAFAAYGATQPLQNLGMGGLGYPQNGNVLAGGASYGGG